MLPFLPGDTRGRAKRPTSEEDDLREKAVQQQMMNQRLVVGMNFSEECLTMLGIVQIKKKSMNRNVAPHILYERL